MIYKKVYIFQPNLKIDDLNGIFSNLKLIGVVHHIKGNMYTFKVYILIEVVLVVLVILCIILYFKFYT